MSQDHENEQGLGLPSLLPTSKSVDVLLIGSPHDRHIEMIRRLESEGLTVEAVPAEAGDDLTPSILRSRIVLHVHRHPNGIFPLARVLRPVILAVPVVCETSIFSAWTNWAESGIVFADYDTLVDACQQLLRSPADQFDRAHQALYFVRELDLDAPFHLMLQGLAAQPAAQPALSAHFGGLGDPFGIELESSLFSEVALMPPESHVRLGAIPLNERSVGDFRLGRWFAVLMLFLLLFMIFK